MCASFFSGGRIIVVTGSGFDLIQTAVMKIQGENMTAFEVCVFSISLSLLFFYCYLPLCHLSLSLLMIHL